MKPPRWKPMAVALLAVSLGTLASATAQAATFPIGSEPPAPDPPNVVFPLEGLPVSQATDLIQVEPHEGSLRFLFIASSPRTEDEVFGRPPGGDPVLHDQVAIIEAGGAGATRVPLSHWPNTLPPGQYWFNFWWTYQSPHRVCVIVLPDGSCDLTFPTSPSTVSASRYTSPRTFTILGPPAPTDAPTPTPAPAGDPLSAPLVIAIQAPKRSRSAKIRVSRSQLRINQRISQAAILRMKAIEARLAGRPVPSTKPAAKNVRFALTRSQLAINQKIAETSLDRANALVAKLEKRPAPPAVKPKRLPLSVAGMRTNQRTLQDAVVRVNAIDQALSRVGL